MNPPTWPEIQAFITGTGFAVFVAIWFLVKTEKTLEKLTAAINRLTDKLNDNHG